MVEVDLLVDEMSSSITITAAFCKSRRGYHCPLCISSISTNTCDCWPRGERASRLKADVKCVKEFVEGSCDPELNPEQAKGKRQWR